MTCEAVYTPNSYKTDLKPVWCPGCGDFGVLNSLYRALADLKCEPHDTVVVSGIGCSSRLPGYVETYGFNSLHGRALPIATGVKLAAPDLTVVAVGGDGDGIAIGGNHFLHSARRNLDIAAVVVSESEGSAASLEETAAAIAQFADAIDLIALPRLATATSEHAAFAQIAGLISGSF